MGKAEHYSSFLSYFERKIEACGWQEVVMSHVFAETATSNEVFVRLFSGRWWSIGLLRAPTQVPAAVPGFEFE